MFLTHYMMEWIVLTVLCLCLPVWSGEYKHTFNHVLIWRCAVSSVKTKLLGDKGQQMFNKASSDTFAGPFVDSTN